MLMGTAVLAGPPQAGGVARVLEAQSAAGYLLSRSYAARLLGCWAENLPLMEAYGAPSLRPFAVSRCTIDVAWKQLQRRDHWYIFTPAFGHQRPGFSDIEKKLVDYDGQTYAFERA